MSRCNELVREWAKKNPNYAKERLDKIRLECKRRKRLYSRLVERHGIEGADAIVYKEGL